MPRVTHQYWLCWRGHKNGPGDRSCSVCGHPHYEKHAQVHASERAVVYYNPATGERRTPPRADLPMPDMYAAQGFERREIMRISDYERETGVVHEATNFNPGNEPAPADPRVPTVSKEVKEQLVDDMRAAMASGSWTGGLPDTV